jgi:allantoicase
MTTDPGTAASFFGLVDLAAEKVGGRVLAVTDEFFAEAENLLQPGRGVFIPDKFTERGKWMDGWESRRSRTPGHDHCTIRLGLPGEIRGLDIDTNHFLGNHPPFASVEACCAAPDATADGLADADWREILPQSALRPGSQNLFAVHATDRFTHLRLHIYPDGGVARLRVYGEVRPDPARLASGERMDLASLDNGGRALACSDMFFGAMQNLLMPGRAANMGDGWESRRRRGPGHDWAIVRLGAPGRIEEVEVDTNHFKGNYPDRCGIDAAHLPDAKLVDLALGGAIRWQELLPERKLQAHTQHRFSDDLADVGVVTHVRLRIYPDGGVSRLRVFGRAQTA